jgi:hypothetical protein
MPTSATTHVKLYRGEIHAKETQTKFIEISVFPFELFENSAAFQSLLNAEIPNH